MLDGLPIDLALLARGLVLGVVVGLATGLASAKRRGQALDHALNIGSAAGLSVPIYWFGFAVLALFAPQSGYLLQIPFLSWYGGYVSPGEDLLGWLLVSVSVALMVPNVILVETAFNLPGFFSQADVGQFLGELGHLPTPDVVQALILEAAALISVTMLITDLLHARLDPQVRTLR
jgi:ABC-type dipeptide/oligopeptide/nickel transport system permease component